jgi:hypothetical protein
MADTMEKSRNAQSLFSSFNIVAGKPVWVFVWLKQKPNLATQGRVFMLKKSADKIGIMSWRRFQAHLRASNRSAAQHHINRTRLRREAKRGD